jgi:hypothetical protein
MTALELKNYKEIETALGESVAKAVLELVSEGQKNLFLTKDDAKSIEQTVIKEDSKLDVKIEKEVTKLEGRIERLQSFLEKNNSETKAELIKWMFLFWVGQLGILFAFLKLLK